ncbi:MAG: hypothetical protein NC320_08065 [Clostridium sp.]|nr:hypothetical protein [Clostridium sp.]MCM1547832.1 hypothetical protein [Ruminococcus sp.]
MKSKKIVIAVLAVMVFIALGIAALYLYKNRNAETVYPSSEIMPENIAVFYQKDDRWKDDPLGSSEYHMGDSGCLTTCIASQLLMQNISVDGIPDITPAALNKFFSDNNVYDSDGNLRWDAAGKALNVDFISKETSEITENELENLIGNNVYPIVCVKRPSGNYHFVLLAGSDKNSFLCMDPLDKDNGIVSLSYYDNKIYSVRYCENKNTAAETLNKDAKIIDESKYYKLLYSDTAYYYEIYNKSGVLIKSGGPFTKPVHLDMPDEWLVKCWYQTGTGISTQWGFYYDTEKDVFSETFIGGLFDEYSGKTICRSKNKLIIRDIFDKTKYYEEINSFENPLSEATEPFIDVRFKDENKIEVTYLTGDNFEKVTEIIDLA